MEFLVSIYEKTNVGAFFRGHKTIEAKNMEEAVKIAQLPKDLQDIAMVEVTPLFRNNIDSNY